jgi:hypothetical protein
VEFAGKKKADKIEFSWLKAVWFLEILPHLPLLT